jgi:hypothetical protein
MGNAKNIKAPILKKRYTQIVKDRTKEPEIFVQEQVVYDAKKIALEDEVPRFGGYNVSSPLS